MMNETRALANYTWTRHRSIVGILLAIFLSGLVLAGASWLLGLSMYFVYGFSFFSEFAVFIGLFIPIGMFSFSYRANMLDPITGYDQWLLRLPIQTWKLAIIPIGMVTVWVTSVWLVIATSINLGTEDSAPVFSQPLCMSACTIFVYALTWKPQRGVWQRITLLIASVPLIFTVAFGCIWVTVEAPRWMPLAFVASVLCYAASVAFAVYSIKLARVSSFQQTRDIDRIAMPEASACGSLKNTCSMADDRLVFKTSIAALLWHDRVKSRSARLRAALVLIPMILFLSVVLPLTAGTAIFGLLFVAALSSVLASSRIEPTVPGDRSTLPSYLLASPLVSCEIALSRLKALAIFYTQLFALLSLLLLAGLVWKPNLETAGRWWTDVAKSLSPSAPLRMILVIYFGILVTSLGLLIRFACVQMYGRHNVVLWLTGAVFFALGIPISIVLAWFVKQSDWEQVQAVALSWLLWSYNLLYVALAIKLIADVVVLRLNWRQANSNSQAVPFFTVWIALVIAIATSAWMIWPGTSLSYTTSVIAAVVAIPISPYFLAPAAVQANRHRLV